MRRLALVLPLCRDGLHSLRLQWRSTMATIVILATGIAATVAAFAIIDTFLLRPVPGVVDEELLVTVRFMPPGRSASAYGSADALLGLRDAGRRAGLIQLGWKCCSNQVAYAPAADAATRVEGANFVSSEYFATLGVTPIVGRLITDAEADDEAAFVAVIGERLWRRDFSADPDVVGRQIRVNHHTFTIVGVLHDLRGWGFSRIGDTDVWAPLSTFDAVSGDGFPAMSVLVGRLARDADARGVEQALQQAYRASGLAPHYLAFQPFVEAGLWPVNQISRASTTLSWALGLSATLVLLLASANGANLTLLRIGERQRSHAIRVALGAPLGRIAVPFVIESTVVGVISGVVGLGMARIALWSLAEARMFASFPDLSHVTLDLRIVAAALVSTVIVIAFVSLLPLMSLMRTDLTPLIGRTTAPHARLWTRRGLLAFQIALTIPIAGATLVLHRAVEHALGTDPAIDVDHVMAITVRPEDAGFDRERTAAYLRAVAESLTAHGLGRVSRSYPALTSNWTASVWLQRADDGDDRRRHLRVFSIAPGFFDIVGARLLAGRSPTPRDSTHSRSAQRGSPSSSSSRWPPSNPQCVPGEFNRRNCCGRKRSRLPTTDYRLPATGYRPPATAHRLQMAPRVSRLGEHRRA